MTILNITFIESETIWETATLTASGVAAGLSVPPDVAEVASEHL